MIAQNSFMMQPEQKWKQWFQNQSVVGIIAKKFSSIRQPKHVRHSMHTWKEKNKANYSLGSNFVIELVFLFSFRSW